MHCQVISCTRSFDMGLATAEGQKLDCFKCTANFIYINSWKSSKYIQYLNHASIISHPGSLYVYHLISMACIHVLDLTEI
jgi:hypothetical protein